MNIKSSLCTLRAPSGAIIATCKLENDLYKLGLASSKCHIDALRTIGSKINKIELWHKRLCHINYTRLSQLVMNSMVLGLENLNTKNISQCTSCIKGKQHRDKFPKEGGTRAKEVLELIHSDICGQMQTSTHSNSTYFITFIDDCTCYTIIYLLRQKFEALENLNDINKWSKTK